MRVKASVTIDERVLKAIDKVTSPAHTAREARDLKILDAAADDLNEEMKDVLAYQTDI